MATGTHSLKKLGIADVIPGGFGGEWVGSGPELEVSTPIDGSTLATGSTGDPSGTKGQRAQTCP